MTRFRILLPLTGEDGRVHFVSPPHVRSITGTEKGALIHFCEGEPLKVRERPEVIAGEIDRWMVTAYFGERERP